MKQIKYIRRIGIVIGCIGLVVLYHQVRAATQEDIRQIVETIHSCT